MDVLISGASIAGPVTAYWLRRSGFRVTVVERAPALRKTGGHAVDLFAPALDIVERMGLLDQVVARRTGTERMVVLREGARRPTTIDLGKLMAGFSRRHVEIMRDDLGEIFYDATRDDVEYVFGDHVTGIGDDGEVTFANGRPRRFDLVIGADGLHSGVRGLVFGPEAAYTRWIGAYIAVASIPNYLDLRDEMRGVTGGRPARRPLQRAAHDGRARPVPVPHPRRAVLRPARRRAQRRLLRERFGDLGWEVPRLLDETDRASAFYFDSVTQLRLEHWTRGRVALVGDAGYCPGPAVGGSTSLAVVGAYTLAGELAAAGGDPARAYPAYEAAMGEYVRRSRAFAVTMAKRHRAHEPGDDVGDDHRREAVHRAAARRSRGGSQRRAPPGCTTPSPCATTRSSPVRPDGRPRHEPRAGGARDEHGHRCSSSSRCTRMISSNDVSATNPRRSARLASSAAAQSPTISMICGSGSWRISRTAASPPTRRSASICSPTVADSPGIESVRRGPISSVSTVAARRQNPTAERGEACQCRTVSGTGSTASLPTSGSRRMLEKNPEAALFGAPGRMQMVGSRMPTPSTKPRRL